MNITDEQTIEIPLNGEILSAQFQNSILCIWVLVNPSEETKPRYFEIYGTGNPFEIGDNRKFIGTLQDGSFVWHLFEKI